MIRNILDWCWLKAHNYCTKHKIEKEFHVAITAGYHVCPECENERWEKRERRLERMRG